MERGKVSVWSIILICIIVLILGAILFPVVTPRSRGCGKSKCLNNLKQLSQSLKLYADDYNGAMPSSGVYKPSISADAFCCQLTAGGTYPPTRGFKRTWPQMLYDNMKNPDIVFCPSDSNTLANNNNIVSYWYKYANDLAWREKTVNKRRMADYGYESDQVAFFEIGGWHFAEPGGLKPLKQYNMSFMDTHVETVVLPPTTQAAAGKPACGPPTPDGYNTIGVGAMHRNCEPWFYNCTVDAKSQPNMLKGPHTTRHNPSTDYDAF